MKLLDRKGQDVLVVGGQRPFLRRCMIALKICYLVKGRRNIINRRVKIHCRKIMVKRYSTEFIYTLTLINKYQTIVKLSSETNQG